MSQLEHAISIFIEFITYLMKGLNVVHFKEFVNISPTFIQKQTAVRNMEPISLFSYYQRCCSTNPRLVK